MQLTVLGSGTAMPVPERRQAGYLIAGGERNLLVDCGAGVLSRLAETDVGYEDVSTVLLTHHHLDHVADLFPLLKARWLAGEEHLEVIGPTGTAALVDGLFSTFEYLDGRVDVAVRGVAAGTSFTAAGFDVTARETRHSLRCLAYRLAAPESDVPAREGPLTLSGDSEAFAGLARFADGTDVFVHDCSFPDDVDVSGHPTPTSLGEALAGTDVGTLVLSHLYPHTAGREEELVRGVRAAGFEGDVVVAHDGMQLSPGEG
ncbi:MBL fold metallo-hydrolase [Halorubrum vacuolatum]|uniref:Ribonuclease BN, tRNA processing enzyme n=1 Tax=Halorubrum vacuolatum TaxID=63740 RepID=A0A238UMS1_HALVU|nr:MBL fold metallo-hydrolase [Halorubrum vacuolatum]SNR23328.1 Ribonuclease BN, tRNA processing enzyme [Halorubrum vacuolatum]